LRSFTHREGGEGGEEVEEAMDSFISSSCRRLSG